MALVDVVAPLAGLALLALLLVDVFLTAFDPGGRSGPLHEWKNRRIWHALRFVAARAGPETAGRVRAACGPVVAAVTVVLWLAMLVASFALIYYPSVLSFQYSPTSPTSGPLEAIYYSAMAASTMGLGDVAATSALLRIATVTEAMLGFALFSASITYVLSTFRELAESRALALQMHDLYEGGPPPLDQAEWQRDLARHLISVTQAYAQFPVLRHFHSATADRSILIQLGQVLAHVHGTPPEHVSRDARTAHLALRRAAARFVRETHAALVLGSSTPDTERDLLVQHREVLRYQLEEQHARRAEGGDA